MLYHLVFTVVLSTIVTSQIIEEIKPEALKKNAELCQMLEKNPFFDIDLIVGKPWRVYYTWNMKTDNRCMDLNFKNATPTIIQRIWNEMYEYLETQPYWNGATLLLSLGKARHEMLLFADQGAAGRFTGVPNVLREGNMGPMRKSVPLLKFQMKMLHGGKFLIMMDCHIGVASLSARPESPPYRSEIEMAASELKIGDGFPSCLKDKKSDEYISF